MIGAAKDLRKIVLDDFQWKYNYLFIITIQSCSNMINPELYPDVDIFTQDISNGGKLTIVRGGWGRQDAKRYMDNVVSELMEGKLHNQFVEIHLDIPQVRVVIEGINNFDYIPLKEFLRPSES